MRPSRLPEAERPTDTAGNRTVRRRHLLALGASVGAALVAGCSTGTERARTAGTDGSPIPSEQPTGPVGTFRLLISDQPVAIDEFDELNVSFDRARIFRAEGAGEDAADATATSTPGATETATEPAGAAPTATESPASTQTETGTGTDTHTATDAGTPTASRTESGQTDGERGDGGQRGFFRIDLGGATVDLTQVVGEKAIGVFDGGLPEGRYAKIELYAAGVEGIVEGERVDVKIPSGKLQIVKPFEIVAGETLRFVFDINVVKKGRTGSYNLLPVISESGVAGRDVEVTEVGTRRGGGTDGSDAPAEGIDTEETPAEEARGSPDGNDRGSGGRGGSDGGPPDGTGGDA